MRLEKNLINIINHNDVAMEGDLVCDCHNEFFQLFHSGIYKKGLFGGFSLKKRENQIIIKAKCTKCSKEYILYDSTIDGICPKGIKLEDFELITQNEIDVYRVNMKYNYETDNYGTDRFEMILIDIEHEGKVIRLFET